HAPCPSSTGLEIHAPSRLSNLPQIIERPRESFLDIPRKAGQLALRGSADEDPDQTSQPQSLSHVLPIRKLLLLQPPKVLSDEADGGTIVHEVVENIVVRDAPHLVRAQ